MSLEYNHALHYVVQTFYLSNTYHIKLEKLTNLCVSNLKAQNFYDGSRQCVDRILDTMHIHNPKNNTQSSLAL